MKLLYACFRKILIQFFSLTVGIVLCLVSFIYSMVAIVLKEPLKNHVLFFQVFFLSICLQDAVLCTVVFRRQKLSHCILYGNETFGAICFK